MNDKIHISWTKIEVTLHGPIDLLKLPLFLRSYVKRLNRLNKKLASLGSAK